MSTVVDLQTRLKKIEDTIQFLTLNKGSKSYLRDNGIIVNGNGMKLNSENVLIGQTNEYLQVDSNGFRYSVVDGETTESIFNFSRSVNELSLTTNISTTGNIKCGSATASGNIDSSSSDTTLVTKGYVDSMGSTQIDLEYSVFYSKWIIKESDIVIEVTATTNNAVYVLSSSESSPTNFIIPDDINDNEYGKIITIVNVSGNKLNIFSSGVVTIKDQNNVLLSSIPNGIIVRFMSYGYNNNGTSDKQWRALNYIVPPAPPVTDGPVTENP